LSPIPWYVRSFGQDYLTLYAHRHQDEARQQVRAIRRLLRPALDAPVLDLACGAGRHLIALHQEGFRSLTGLDLSPQLLDEARTQLERIDAADVVLVRADMRRVPFRERFALVLSLFTSIGYFERDEDNLQILHSAHDALHAEGTLLIDTLNRPALIDTLVPEERRAVEGCTLRARRRFDDRRSRVLKTTDVTFPDGTVRRFEESVRVYDGPESAGLLRGVGFGSVRCYGSLAGDAYDSTSPRLIAVAHRPRTARPARSASELR
jgi:SAM-dependent methyltransferase